MAVARSECSRAGIGKVCTDDELGGLVSGLRVLVSVVSEVGGHGEQSVLMSGAH